MVDKLANLILQQLFLSHLTSTVNVLSIQSFKPHIIHVATCPTTVVLLHVANNKRIMATSCVTRTNQHFLTTPPCKW